MAKPEARSEKASLTNIYEWACEISSKILDRLGKEEGIDRIKTIYYAIRGEETPGRFLEKLSKEVGEVFFSEGISSSKGQLVAYELLHHVHGDMFYLAKAAVIMGLLNALSEGGCKKDKSSGGGASE